MLELSVCRSGHSIDPSDGSWSSRVLKVENEGRIKNTYNIKLSTH